MARNKYPGICYRCGRTVAVGAGHFERHKGKWRTQHADCAVTAKTNGGLSFASAEDYGDTNGDWPEMAYYHGSD